MRRCELSKIVYGRKLFAVPSMDLSSLESSIVNDYMENRDLKNVAAVTESSFRIPRVF